MSSTLADTSSPVATPSTPEGHPPSGERPCQPLLADALDLSDDEALDILFTCWPRTTGNSTNRDLLAVAQNLARRFGQPGRTPLAATRAWRMLDANVFEAEIAAQLAAIAAFIRDWQATRKSFLILEFGEIELIELLFEALHPGRHADLLVNVMNFKVLSNRRLGLLRRVPMRMRKITDPMIAAQRHADALIEMAHAKALLERIADPLGFAPIVEAARIAIQNVEKLMKQTAAASAPKLPDGAGGAPLARIEVAKIPAP